MEENLEAILEKINTSVEERVNAAIKTGIVRISQQYLQVDQANTTATTDLKAQVADLKSTVAQLHSQLGALSSDISAGDGESEKNRHLQNPATRIRAERNPRRDNHLENRATMGK